MGDSFRGEWLLTAAAKWQPVGRHKGAEGTTNAGRWGGSWRKS